MSTEVQTYGLSNIGHKELVQIEGEINAEFDKVEMTARDSFIKMGGLLDEARGLINDDQAFGAWRKDRTRFESKENANKAMLLHRAVKDGTITTKMLDSKMSQSHLLEIKDAPLSVQNDVETLLDSGNVPTIKNLREMKKLATAKTEEKSEGETKFTKTTKDEPKQETKASEQYQEKEEGIKRTKPQQFGDLLSQIQQIVEEDIMPITVELHTLASKGLNDQQRVDAINALRRELKSMADNLDSTIDFNEGRN